MLVAVADVHKDHMESSLKNLANKHQGKVEVPEDHKFLGFDAYKQAIALAFYHGLSHAELAGDFRQPLGTIKSRIRRGLECLRHCLEGTREASPWGSDP